MRTAVRNPEPISAFVRLMADALTAIEQAPTPDARRAAEQAMARLIQAAVTGPTGQERDDR